MKSLLMLFCCLWPALVNAQALGSPPSMVFTQPNSGMLNYTLLKLANKAVLYQELSDTVGSRRALRLRPGETVVLIRESPHWYLVQRGSKDCMGFSSDERRYYLRRSATNKAQMYVLI